MPSRTLTQTQAFEKIGRQLAAHFGLEVFPRNEARGGGVDIVLGQRTMGTCRRAVDVFDWLEDNGYIVPDPEPAAAPVLALVE